MVSRRRFLKVGAATGSVMTLGWPSVAKIVAAESLNDSNASYPLELTVAGYPFDHVRPLIDGRVQVKGCNTTFQQGKIGDLNTHVFSGPQELEVSEVGLSPFMLAYANEDFSDYSLIPVFPLRLFRHKSIFIHADRGIKRPEDLKGRRIGTPGYSSTSLTWIRGFMQHEYGVKPEDVEWVVSMLDSSAKDAGKVSKQESIVPKGISISVGPEGKDESQMLVDGDVDALFHAAEPKAFTEGIPGSNACSRILARRSATISNAPAYSRSCMPWPCATMSSTRIRGCPSQSSTPTATPSRCSMRSCACNGYSACCRGLGRSSKKPVR